MVSPGEINAIWQCRSGLYECALASVSLAERSTNRDQFAYSKAL
jgi:hypothetical protein